MKAIVLFDFSGLTDSGELSIVKDEILTVTRQDIGDGWWEGINSKSQRGLFPASYVQLLPGGNSDPVEESINSWNTPIQHTNQDYGTSQTVPSSQPSLVSFPAVQPPASSLHNQNSNNNNTNQFNNDIEDAAGWDDEEWDDDDSQASEATAGPGDYHPSGLNLPHNQLAAIHISSHHRHGNGGGGGGRPQPTIKKSINRFSHFVKSGGEDYILGLKTHNVNQHDYIHIVFENSMLKWSPTYFDVKISVENPKKESKMKGLKSYIAYQLTPSDSGIPVSRRYKHFDWLHERLQDKFTTIPIPSLPDKQISGRYQEDFIQNRRIQLQSWVNRISRHPVLSESTVWKHFITCKDEKQWKSGKRRAEKDELVGGLFFLTIQIPENATIDPKMEVKLEQFSRFISKLDESTKNTCNVAQDMIKKYQSYYGKEFSKVGSVFSNLAEAFGSFPSEHAEANRRLIEGMNYASKQYQAMGQVFEEQQWLDFGPLSNLMHEYRGILTAWPEIYQVYKGAIQKKKEHRKAFDEGRLDQKSLEGINRRADVVTYATIAEMNHFEEERINDFNGIMRTFLQGQLKLYKEMVQSIESALQMFPEPENERARRS